MLKLPHTKITVNEEKDIINVSFRMTKELYNKIRSTDMVQDLGLCVLTAIEKSVAPQDKPDSMELSPVEVKEKYDD